MDLEERQKYWETFSKLNENSTEEDLKKIKITTPKYIYRYRQANIKSIDALRRNALYFSSANYFDDPFDTLMYIDTNAISNSINNSINSDESTQNAVLFIENTFGAKLTAGELKDIITTQKLPFLNNISEFRNALKSEVWSICFSEDGLNEVLWLTAETRKGVAVNYLTA